MNKHTIRSKCRLSRQFLAIVLVAALAAVIRPSVAFAAESNTDYTAVPPFVSQALTPNVLIILDSSNSMDEDVDGNAVGSDAANSRSEIARQAILSLIQANSHRMRIGLMAYQQSGVVRRNLHNAFYYCSYDPTTYDPAGAPTPKDPATNARRWPNPDDGDGNPYIYYDQAAPYYSSGNDGTGYCFSYNFTEDADSSNDQYRYFDVKSGDTDPPSGTSATGSPGLADYGYSSYIGTYTFSPTDSDIAAGFTEFGEQLSWAHVGLTWFSNTSPGKGYLHVPVDDSSTAHLTDLANKLDTSNFSTNTADHPNNDLDTPIRNAGLTPLEGTLESSRVYYQGSLAASQGGPATTPIQYWCQKNFVVLVTDGLPSTDKDGNAGDADTLLAGVEAEITALRSTTVGGFTDPFDIPTYVLGFALDPTLGSKLDDLAVAGGTDVNGHAYLANNPTELSETLNSILLEIFKRVSSGTAASVISNSRSGEGATYQSIFYPYYNDSGCGVSPANEVNWVGDVHALFTDAYGNLREDTNGDRSLNLSTDKIVIFDGLDVYKFTDSDADGLLEPGEGFTDVNGNGKLDLDSDTIHGSVPRVTINDIGHLWSANDWLNDSALVATSERTTYISSEKRRHIFTFIDATPNMVKDANEVKAFTTGNKTDISPYLHLFPPFAYSSSSPPPGIDSADFNAFVSRQPERIIDFIRGADQAAESVGVSSTIPAMRSREIDYNCDASTETWRLGDVAHSTPTVVGQPGEDYDIIYQDTTYRDFYVKYRHRRSVVYVGGNDGMMHGFNAGFFDSSQKKFWKKYDGAIPQYSDPGTAPELGAELWAYVPFNLLPHLYWLTDPDYEHVYYVDLKPKVFDARIYDPSLGANDTHPRGWATILVGGMRFGGGRIRTDKNHDGAYDPNTDDHMHSSYFILDITDPENPPVLLAEVTFDDLGYTTSYPGVIVVNPKDTTSENDWHLVLGSGPAGAKIGVSNLGFSVNDTVTGDASGATAEIGAIDTTNKILTLRKAVGRFTNGETVFVDADLDGLVDGGETQATVDLMNAVWALVDGASSQQARIYMIDLKELAQNNQLRDPNGAAVASAFATIPDNDSFVSDFVSADLNLDYRTNVVYFGTVSGAPSSWGGKLRRFVLSDPDTGIVPTNANTWDMDSTLYDANRPITAAPTPAQDDKRRTWIYFGTGRFLNRADVLDSASQTYYGIKESWADANSNGIVDIDVDTSSPADGIVDHSDMTWATVTGGLFDVTDVLVYENGNIKTGGGGNVTALDGSTSLNTFTALVAEMGKDPAPSPAQNPSGWSLSFTVTGERNVGQAALLGDILSFTAYVPDDDPCEYEGSSKLYATHFMTGTAFESPVIGLGSATDPSDPSSHEVLRSTSLGGGLAISPNIHTGREKGSKAYIQTSTGSILVIEQQNPGAVKSGKTYWMEE